MIICPLPPPTFSPPWNCYCSLNNFSPWLHQRPSTLHRQPQYNTPLHFHYKPPTAATTTSFALGCTALPVSSSSSNASNLAFHYFSLCCHTGSFIIFFVLPCTLVVLPGAFPIGCIAMPLFLCSPLFSEWGMLPIVQPPTL